MFRKLATLAIATVAVIGLATTSATAKPKINPVAAGLVGAAVVTTAIAASSAHHYRHPHRHCYWKPHYNMFGQVMHYHRVCYWH